MVVTKYDAEAQAKTEEIPDNNLYKVTDMSSCNLDKLAEDSEPKPRDFETAITATGYGSFNVLLLLGTLPAFWSAVSVTSSVSYIFSRARCDMDLTTLDMGILNAMTYGGMISSGMLWGYLSDNLGRRSIIVWGYLGTGLLEISAGLSQNFLILVATKFASGFIFNGPFAVLLTYIAELHRTEIRARVMVLTSLFFTLANATLPLLAWAFLTKNRDFYFLGGRYVLHSWNQFLLATAVAPILAGIAFFFLPESPKFLMSRGRNEEAMKMFRTIYAMNTKNPKAKFPITRLVEEKSKAQPKGIAALRGGMAQIAPLFQLPCVLWLLLMCLIGFGTMFATNTLHLWYPQLAALQGSTANGSLCQAIAPSTPAPAHAVTCTPIKTDMNTYLQSVVVGLGSIITFAFGGLLVNKCGKKTLTGLCSFFSGMVIVLLPLLDAGEFTVVGVVMTALALTSVCETTLYTITVDLFPTSLRVMALATFMMSGRIGTIAGTMTFPALIRFGCYPPFITIAVVLAVCGVATGLVPDTDLKKLE